jgi:multicomponent Na+:H+ antiporter subunit D
LEAGVHWPLYVLTASSLLNAAYFLPILHRAWFVEPSGAWTEPSAGAAVGDEPRSAPAGAGSPRLETRLLLLLPPLVTAALSLLVGLLASMPFSALEWSLLIAEREFHYP